MTALTVNGSAAAATTLAAAGKLFNATGGTSGNTSTKVGTSTQFKQIFATGTTTNQTGVASIPAPTDSNFSGWMWDVSTLEGQRLAAGTFTPTIHLLASTSTTVTPTVAWYKRSSGGVYTSIGSVAGSSIALTTSSQVLTFTPPSLALMDFATGDKLVMWLWVNQTAGGATNSTISVVEATSGSSAGVTSEAQTATPGYAPTPVALSVTMAGVGVLTPALSANLPLPSVTLAGVGTMTGTAQLSTALTTTLPGVGILTPALSANLTLPSVTLAGAGALSLPGSESLYLSTVLGDAPLRYYRLDASSGTVTTDLGSQAQDGTLHGGVTLSQAGLLTGNSDTAELFNGSNGYISASASGLPTGAAAWSIECWIKISSQLNNFEVPLCFGTRAANQEAEFYFNTDHTIHVSFDNATDIVGPVPSLNTPHHAVATYNGSLLTFYVDGASVGTPVTATAAIGSGGVTIGVDVGLGFGWFPGVIDEVAIYGAALSAGQVSAHYTAGTSPLALALATAFTTTLTGTGSLTGTFSTSSGGVSLTAQCDGVGTLTGTPALTTNLATSMAGAGTLTGGTLSLTATLADTLLVSTGTLAPGTLALVTALSTTFVGVGTLSGTESFASALSTTLPGAGALTGVIALAIPLAVQFPAVGTLEGSGSFALFLPGVSLVGSGTLTGTLDTSTHVVLAVTCTGSCTLVGTLALTTSLPTSMLAGSGALDGTLALTTSFLVTLGGESTLVCTLGLQTVLTAHMVGTGILASTLFLSTALTASFLGAGTATALFSMQVALSLLVVGRGTSHAVINALGAVVLSLRPIGSLPPSSYEGKTVVPARPSGIYLVNGIPLDSQPIVCTAPLESGGGLRFLVGSTFFLLFDRPSMLTQSLLPDGGVVSMTFALASGNMVTVPQVQVASTLVMGGSISTLAVTCTLLSFLATPTLSLASSS